MSSMRMDSMCVSPAAPLCGMVPRQRQAVPGAPPGRGRAARGARPGSCRAGAAAGGLPALYMYVVTPGGTVCPGV